MLFKTDKYILNYHYYQTILFITYTKIFQDPQSSEKMITYRKFWVQKTTKLWRSHFEKARRRGCKVQVVVFMREGWVECFCIKMAEDITEMSPPDITSREALSEGLLALFKPAIQELDSKVHNVR